MTVDETITQLQKISEMGFGSLIVVSFNSGMDEDLHTGIGPISIISKNFNVDPLVTHKDDTNFVVSVN